MKKINFRIVLITGLAATVMLYACKKSFLDKPALGTLEERNLTSFAGVQGLLISAYSTLNGFGNAGGGLYSGPSYWAFAGIDLDDA